MNKKIYKQIYKAIEKYDTIVIARHIRIDPDAMASQIALRDSIKMTFPNKQVYAIGNGTVRFNYIGKLDPLPKDISSSSLLIVTDTPDKKRVDLLDFNNYAYSIKIDHHPFIESFCDIELSDENKSSASEMVCDLINNTKLMMDKGIAKTIFYGIVSDTNRFLYNNVRPSTFMSVSLLMDKYDLNITDYYNNLYKRPFKEIELLGYMTNNMKITDNGVGYVKIDDKTINKYQVDTLSSGDLINEFNHVSELLVWLIATEDVKNSCIRISIRSRGPIINKVAEKFGGGGHNLASGARVPSFDEVDDLIKKLDKVCEKYIKESDTDED